MAAPKETAQRKTGRKKVAQKAAAKRRGPTISVARARAIARAMVREMDEKGERPTSGSLSVKDTATGSGKIVFHAARVLARLEGRPLPRRTGRALSGSPRPTSLDLVHEGESAARAPSEPVRPRVSARR